MEKLKYVKPVLVLLAIILVFIFSRNFMEPFLCGGVSELVNAHGSKSAGFASFSGNKEQEQNKDAEHVNPMYKDGNPANPYPEYRNQPV